MDEEDLKLINDIALLDKQLEIETTNHENINEIISSVNVENVSVPSTSAIVGSLSPSVLNSSCQEILKKIEEILLKRLKENREEQEILMKYLKNSMKKSQTSDGNTVHKIKCAGIPYFKDSDGYPQPRNEDVNERLANGELCCVEYLPGARIWSKQDKECLRKAVLGEFEPKTDFKVHVNEEQQTLEPTNPEQRTISLPKRSIDWMKISVTDFNGKYSAGECESQWRLYLRPEINKTKWTINEIESLNNLAKSYNYQDWDAIAKALGTNRTGLQCCIQYQTKNSLNEGKWSAEEDAYLKKLIQTFSRGSSIPWIKISWYFQTRSRKQCQGRYLECLNSNLKRGAFSQAEDKIIITGSKIFSDFGKIANFLPGRVPTQIRSRYYYLIGTLMSQFTKEEDDLLMSLAKTYSKKWHKISEHFENRTNLQCRKRYEMLCKQNRTNTRKKTHKVMPKDQEPKVNAISKDNSAGLACKNNAMKKRRRKKDPNENLSIPNDILTYFEFCSQNLFGPKIRNPTNTEELNDLLNQLKAVMGMLSISCDMSEKMGSIYALKWNSEFEPYDVKMLTLLSEEDSFGDQTSKDDYLLNGMLIPPNYTTMTGLQTLMLRRGKILSSTWESEGLPKEVRRSRAEETRISFTKAKKLFRSRFSSLFLLPMALVHINSNDFSDEYFVKGKTKKPKKLTKKWLKAHAKFMSSINQEKRKRKKAELENTNDEDVSLGVNESTGNDVNSQCLSDSIEEISRKKAKKRRTDSHN